MAPCPRGYGQHKLAPVGHTTQQKENTRLGEDGNRSGRSEQEEWGGYDKDMLYAWRSQKSKKTLYLNRVGAQGLHGSAPDGVLELKRDMDM